MRRQLDDLDDPRQRRHDRPQRGQLLIGEAAGLLRGPARCVDQTVGEQQRQRDIIRDAFGAQVLDDREAAAGGVVDAGAHLDPLLEHDGQRAGLKFRRFQNPEIDRADLDLGAGPPDEIAAEDFGMQGADEDDRPATAAGPPRPSARRFPPSCGRACRRPRAVDQPVGEFLQFRCVHGISICRASPAHVKAYNRCAAAPSGGVTRRPGCASLSA